MVALCWQKTSPHECMDDFEIVYHKQSEMGLSLLMSSVICQSFELLVKQGVT